MEPERLMTCGGFDPYNSATTDPRWFFLIAARDAERTGRVRALFEAVRKNPEALVMAVKAAQNKAFGKFAL
jgi:hypothetical protein